MPIDPTIKQIRYFIAIAEAGSYRQAALTLNMSQPPLSQHMENLEHALGLELFDRTTQRVSLTPTGLLFLDEAKGLVTHLERCVQATRAFGRGATGRLRIGIADEFLNAPIFFRLVDFIGSNKDIACQLTLGDSMALVRELASAALDLVFANLPLATDISDFGQIPVQPTRILLAVPEDHEWAGRSSVDPALIGDRPFIMIPEHSTLPFDLQCRRLLAAAGVNPNVVCEASHTGLQIQLVRRGVGISLISEFSTAKGQAGLVGVPIDHPMAKISHAILYRRINAPPALDRLVKAIGSAAPGSAKGTPK